MKYFTNMSYSTKSEIRLLLWRKTNHRHYIESVGCHISVGDVFKFVSIDNDRQIGVIVGVLSTIFSIPTADDPPIVDKSLAYLNNNVWVRVAWLHCRDDFSALKKNIAPINSQKYRYYEKHKKVLLTNILDWMPAVEIEKVAFVFSINDVQKGKYKIAGMENAFFLPYFYTERREGHFGHIAKLNDSNDFFFHSLTFILHRHEEILTFLQVSTSIYGILYQRLEEVLFLSFAINWKNR